MSDQREIQIQEILEALTEQSDLARLKAFVIDRAFGGDQSAFVSEYRSFVEHARATATSLSDYEGKRRAVREDLIARIRTYCDEEQKTTSVDVEDVERITDLVLIALKLGIPHDGTLDHLIGRDHLIEYLNEYLQNGDVNDDALRHLLRNRIDRMGRSELRAFAQATAPQVIKPGPESVPIEEADYAKRPKGETAPQFIARVYGPWLDGTLTRGQLERINPPAHRGLYNYESTRGRVPASVLNLPTEEEIFARKLESGELDEEIRAARRLIRRAERHKQPS